MFFVVLIVFSQHVEGKPTNFLLITSPQGEETGWKPYRTWVSGPSASLQLLLTPSSKQPKTPYLSGLAA